MRAAESRVPGRLSQILVLASILLLAQLPLVAAPIVVDPLADGIIGGIGLGAFVLSEFLPAALEADRTAGTGPGAYPGGYPAGDPGTVNDFDRLFLGSYNGTADLASTIVMALTCLTPALVPFYDSQGWLEVGLVTAESLAWTRATTNVLKEVNPRWRPWTYQNGYRPEADQLAEADQSWPSGHTALAFAGAATASTLAIALHPDNPATPWVVAGSLGLACLTAGLRVASGEHFASDTLAGAAIGGAIGTVNALIHLAGLSLGKLRQSDTY